MLDIRYNFDWAIVLKKRIVGICGLKGSGKSTLMRQIQGAEHIYFAQPLKQALEAMGIPPEALHHPPTKEAPLDLLCWHTPRYAMQTLGTEWGRKRIGDTFWVRLWAKKVRESSAEVIICDDVRFPEEIEAIRDQPDHLLVYIQRPSQSLYVAPPWWKLWVKKPHPSERLNPKTFDIPVLLNDSTPEALYQKFLEL